MRCSNIKANRLALCGVLLVSVASNTGCKSGFSFPGSSMFAWSKKPSQETLAGKGPTVTTPTSPAQGQTPGLIASTPPKTSIKSNPYGTSSLTNSSTNPSLPSNTLASATTPYSQPAGSSTKPSMGGMGSAAAANGYATGPYNTYGQAANAAGSYAQAGAAYGQAVANNAATAVNNATAPYTAPVNNAAAYPGLAGTTPVQTPNYGEPAVPQIPSLQTYSGQTANSLYSMPNAQTNAVAQNGPQSAFPVPPANMPTNTPSMSSYAPIGQGSGQLASGPTSTQAATAGYAVPSGGTQASTASYRPGSTQRTTGYDFSTTGTQVSPSLPANTATGTSNPGYSMPPSGAFR